LRIKGLVVVLVEPTEQQGHMSRLGSDGIHCST
jgi:hypothetical protein